MDSANAQTGSWRSIRTEKDDFNDVCSAQQLAYDVLALSLAGGRFGKANTVHAAGLRTFDDLGIEFGQQRRYGGAVAPSAKPTSSVLPLAGTCLPLAV